MRSDRSGCPLLPVETVVLLPVNYEQFPRDRVALCADKCYDIIAKGIRLEVFVLIKRVQTEKTQQFLIPKQQICQIFSFHFFIF